MGGAEAIGGVDNGQFSASMGTVGCGGPMWCSHHHYCTCMGVVGEGAQGIWSGARGRGEKVSMVMGMIGTLS